MSDEATVAAEAKVPPKLIRGRMPVAIVSIVKGLLESGEDFNDSSLATLFATTSGKIHDVRKNRCFGYVDAGMPLSEDQITQAKEWLTKHPAGAESNEVAQITNLIDQQPAATPEQVESFNTARDGSRKPRKKKEAAEGEVSTVQTPVEVDENADEGADETDVDDLLS